MLLCANCARPMMPAAPPLFSYCTLSAALASSSAAPRLRPVVSQPPPGLAGIISLRLGAAAAGKGSAPAAASAARDLRNSSRRMDVSWLEWEPMVDSTAVNPLSRNLGITR